MRNAKRRRRGHGWLLWLAAALCLLLAGIASGWAAALGVQAARREAPPALSAVGSDTAAPAARSVPAGTSAPVAEAEAGFEYLPVIRRVNTQRRQIAVTVDDCFQVDNLKAIAETARANGGRLTLFPIGQNLEKPGMAALMRRCAFELGFEIENHTWSHQRIFRLPEAEMAREIWQQGQALNRALGVNYEQHFFRLMGGDGDCDQRTHSYLKQLGFSAIANWSISGSDADMAAIRAALKPGAVYLFHTTDGDTQKLKSFIPYAVSQGYELVTLNELLGLPSNATSPRTEAAMPAPAAFRCDYRTRRQGDYAWCVVGMQDALRRLGLLRMSGPSTGYYGPRTRAAVEAFQQSRGLPVTGEADAQTQRLLCG